MPIMGVSSTKVRMALEQKQADVPWNSVPAGSVPGGLFREGSNGATAGHRGLTKQHTVTDFSGQADKESGDARFECCVCLGEYQESGRGVPRSLMCGHTFCTGCLIDLVKESIIVCPKCKQATPIASHGVEMSLVKNYGVLEIIYTHPSSYRARRSPSPRPVALSKRISLCNEDQISFTTTDTPICGIHGDRLTSFCVRDRVLVCSSCLLYGTHKDHPCQPVKDAGMEYKQRLRKLIPDITKKNDEMRAAIIDLGRTVKKVQQSSDTLETKIDDHFDKLIAMLVERKNELKVEVLHRSQDRVEALVEQTHSLEEAVVTADDCYTEIKDQLGASNHEFLNKYSSMSRNILMLFAHTAPTTPIAQDDLTVTFPPEDLTKEFQEQFKGHGSVQSEVGVVEEILYDSYHDGFRVYWQNQNYIDSEGCTYSLQIGLPGEEYTTVYRGGNTKFTYRRDDLVSKRPYKFRVRVQTLQSVGLWSAPVECYSAPPSWTWDKRRRNFKIDISSDCLEASSHFSSGSHWASVAGNKVFHNGVYYMEIEILELAKHHIHKSWFTKIALGVVHCSESSINDISWQDGSNPIGRLTTKTNSQAHNSWGFLINSGTKSSTTSSREEEYTDATPILVVGDKIGMLVKINEHEKSQLKFYCNGNDLGVAYTNLVPPLVPILSVCDKFAVRLRFPPPPYSKQDARVTILSDDPCT